MAGLNNLWQLYLHDNDALTTVDGLSSLADVSHTLTVDENDALWSVAGLLGLNTIGDDFTIEHNPSLWQTAAQSVADGATISGTITLQGNNDGC